MFRKSSYSSTSSKKSAQLANVNSSTPNSRVLAAVPDSQQQHSNTAHRASSGSYSDTSESSDEEKTPNSELVEDSESAESESEEEEESDAEEEEVKSQKVKSEGRTSARFANGHGNTGRMKDHVRLAEESRSSKPIKRIRKGIPLTSLTLNDLEGTTPEQLAVDIRETHRALHLFLNSSMLEAEEICLSGADHRMYYSIGYALISVIKALASFEPVDLANAVDKCKNAAVIANLLRKKDHGAFEKVGALVKGSTSAASIRSMTHVQRHAELTFSEASLLKSVIGIVYSGDFITFLKEALNMRNAYATYRVLAKFVEEADANGKDATIDEDFRSGVFLGNGMISMILSLLPGTVLKIMEVFGFTGDRDYALKTLMAAGGWKAGVREPSTNPAEEGVRRPFADMMLLSYHLVISSYLPVGGVDIPTSDAILHYNLERYPNGIFFLYFSGRLYSTQALLDTAHKQFHLAILAQKEYVQLQHICHWDLGLVALASGDWKKGFECFDILNKDSNWSKAIYAYAKGCMLYEQGKEKATTNAIMPDVPVLMQRIAGKSIPLEKFVARRATKYVTQGGRLMLPGIELGYVFNVLGMTPRHVLLDTHLNQISTALAELHAVKDEQSWGQNGNEYWDDFCLAHLLRAIVLRFIAHPEPHTVPQPAKSPIPIAEADAQAMISIEKVLSNATKILHDHHLVWFAHYEKGRLYQSMGHFDRAKVEFETVLAGKFPSEIVTKKDNGKVSLQNMCVLRSNSAILSMK